MTRVQLKRSAKGERRLRVVAKAGAERKRCTRHNAAARHDAARHDAAAALLERVRSSTRELKESGDLIEGFTTKMHAFVGATTAIEIARQIRILKAARAVTGAFASFAKPEGSRAAPERMTGLMMLAMEEDVEPSVAIEQFEEAIDVVMAAGPPEYVAAVRLLERVRSSTLELTADDYSDNLYEKGMRAFDALQGLGIDERIDKGDRIEMGAHVATVAMKIRTLLLWSKANDEPHGYHELVLTECSEANLQAIHGLVAVAMEDDIKPLVALEQFQEAVEVLSSPEVEDPMLHMDLLAFCHLHSPLVSQLLSLHWPPRM
jgi:SpoU rRNA methylase family enzyme